jgi:hypothetical protein
MPRGVLPTTVECSSQGQNFEGWMLGCDRTQTLIAGVWSSAVEKWADFYLPSLQVRPQHRYLLIVGELATPERFDVLA